MDAAKKNKWDVFVISGVETNLTDIRIFFGGTHLPTTNESLSLNSSHSYLINATGPVYVEIIVYQGYVWSTYAQPGFRFNYQIQDSTPIDEKGYKIIDANVDPSIFKEEINIKSEEVIVDDSFDWIRALKITLWIGVPLLITMMALIFVYWICKEARQREAARQKLLEEERE